MTTEGSRTYPTCYAGTRYGVVVSCPECGRFPVVSQTTFYPTRPAIFAWRCGCHTPTCPRVGSLCFKATPEEAVIEWNDWALSGLAEPMDDTERGGR